VYKNISLSSALEETRKRTDGLEPIVECEDFLTHSMQVVDAISTCNDWLQTVHNLGLFMSGLTGWASKYLWKGASTSPPDGAGQRI
jgi:hypothetical protein